MSKKIYVGNISFNTQENELRELFAQYGDVVNVNIIVDRNTNRSKGFGFVEMQDDSAGTAAISALNGAVLSGRDLKVNEAMERKERSSYNNFR